MKVKDLIAALDIVDKNLDIVVQDADEGPGTLLNIQVIVDEGEYIIIETGYDDRYIKAGEK